MTSEAMIAVLEANGWTIAGRGPAYVRLTGPTMLIVPLEPAYADYDELMGDLFAELEMLAQHGRQAQAVLDHLAQVVLDYLKAPGEPS